MPGDDDAPYRFIPGDSEVLLVVFGGILSGFAGVPVFEFGRTTKDMPWDRLMLRDHRQAWYLRGLPGEGDDLDAVIAVVRRHIEERAPRRVVMVGNSAGGFAALAVGAAVGADQVIAFAPQTTITPWHRAWVRDRRWRAEMRRMGWRRGPGADLRRLSGWRGADIHFPAGHRLDAWHARRLAGMPGVRLHPHDGADHTLVADLARGGRLQPMLQEACAPTRSTPETQH